MARSNRQATQYVIDALNRCLAEGYSQRKIIIHSTSDTRLEASKNQYVIKLHGQPIMRLDKHPENPQKLVRITCTTGFFYDRFGVPSCKTRERLNGLLDYLGDRGYLPQGVRVFVDEEGCWVGKGDECIGLDKDDPIVTIESNPHNLVMS